MVPSDTHLDPDLASYTPEYLERLLYLTNMCPPAQDLETPAVVDPVFSPLEDEDLNDDEILDVDAPVTFESEGEMEQDRPLTYILPKEARERSLHALEMVALSFLRQTACEQIEIKLVSRNKATEKEGSAPHHIMRWPKRAKKGTFRRFACLFRVIELICEALTKNVPTTKREIFYHDVRLFRSQAIVDDLVDDLAATIGVTRADLHVRASAKGLFCGSGLKVRLGSGGIIHGNTREGALIPASAEISHLDISDNVCWVLIVEKEGMFQTLCRVGFDSNPLCPGPGIMITLKGKGYPDLATRELVCRLSLSLSPSIPILAFIDADAHGMEILSVYKYGSQKLSHEGPKVVTPRLGWLGLCGSELSRLGIDRSKLIPLTKHDRKKALDMLRRHSTVMPMQWRKELSHMLYSHHKAEIEILSSVSTRTTYRPRLPQPLPVEMFQQVENPHEELPLVQYLAAKLHLWVNSPL